MTRHIFIEIGGRDAIDERAQDLIVDKLLVFHNEHLLPVVLKAYSGVEWDLDWWGPTALRFSYEVPTSTYEDRALDRHLVRYLEISVLPLVLYDDNPQLSLTSHDKNFDEGAPHDCASCYSERVNEEFSLVSVAGMNTVDLDA